MRLLQKFQSLRSFLPPHVLVSLSCLSLVHVLISTYLYIAGLSPHSGCLCYWKSEEWDEYAALSGPEEKTEAGRKKERGWRGRKRH